jgi:selenocysteine lyase/cysteine desulfurase
LDTYPADIELARRLRGSLAKLIHAEGHARIAFQSSTSDALNIVAGGLRWKSGDRILLNDLEFPANVYPYLNLKKHGVELDVIPSRDGMVTVEMIERWLGPRTKLLALSAVQFLSGHRADLAAIGSLCRRRGIIFAVDGIQAVGAMKIDVQAMSIDAFAAGAQKWQLAPHGTGFLYVSEDLQSRIQQQYLGWLAVEDPWNFRNYDQPLAHSARRYEGGSLNLPGLHGYEAAVSTLLEFGPDAIENHILDLTAVLREGLQALPGVKVITPPRREDHAGIISIQLPSTTNDKRFFVNMQENGVTPALREGKVRYSPHFYNTVEEMERTVEITRQSLGNS